MRVMQIVQRFAPGGLETIAASLQGRWSADCRIVSLDGATGRLLEAWPAMGGLRANLVGMGKMPGIDLPCLARLTRRMMDHKPDAVITHHLGPLLYGGIAARLARVPVIAHVEHDAWHLQDAAQLRRFKIARALARPRLAAISQLGARNLAQVIGEDVQNVANGIDMERFKPACRQAARARLGLPSRDLSQDGKLIGVVARLERVKGVDLLISALAHHDEPNLNLAIIGDGRERESLEAQARALALGSRVQFLGVRGAIETILPAFDAFVLPSRAEGLPLAIVEAQACGIPIVASDVGAVREACCPDTAILAPSGNSELLAKSIGRQLARTLVCSPRKFVMRRFSLDQMISDYARLTGAPA